MPSFDHRENSFIEIGISQENKSGCLICGDAFISRKIKGENRYVSVLSDGLGSGIKANVLSTMTASMAMSFSLRNEPVVQTALTIMDTLPTDSVRNISYATFTIVDIDNDGDTTVVEFDNPGYILFREGKEIETAKEEIMLPERKAGRGILLSHIHLCKNDRLILFTDGVNQSGIGREAFPFGWEREGVIHLVEDTLKKYPDISAHDLSRVVVKHAVANDGYLPLDDTSCAVIYMRQPRDLLICSGPPYDQGKDRYLANLVMGYPGKKIICGGTTSKIISRELHREISMDIENPIDKLPPAARMEGIDLVTEGILTLCAVADMLEKGIATEQLPETPDGDIVRLIFESDRIDIVVGTRINEAHQDPNLPVDLEIRRNIIKRITTLLEEKYLKKVQVKFL